MTTVDGRVTIGLAGGEVTLELAGVARFEAAAVFKIFVDVLDALPDTDTPVVAAAPSHHEPPPSPEPVKPVAAAKTNGAAPTTECDVCGKTVKRAGLAVHKARAHGVAGAHAHRREPNGNGSTPAAAAPEQSDDPEDELVLRCNDCDYTTDRHSFAKLRTHITMSHHRAPYPGVEDRPRNAHALDLIAG